MDKLTIIGVEGAASNVTVVAQFNPKEISIDRSVPWQLQAVHLAVGAAIWFALVGWAALARRAARALP